MHEWREVMGAKKEGAIGVPQVRSNGCHYGVSTVRSLIVWRSGARRGGVKEVVTAVGISENPGVIGDLASRPYWWG